MISNYFTRWVFIPTIIVCMALPAGAQESIRQKINFDEDWKFHFGHAADPERDFNYSLVTIYSKTGGVRRTAISGRFNDSTWRSLNLPHDWAVELPFENRADFNLRSHGYKPVGGHFPETSIGWYRKHFEVSRSDSGKRFELQFDGIFRDSEFWLNGHYLGNNKSGYIGISFDITDFLNFGRENVLVVRVDATQYEGWFYEGAGIYRHVWLIRHDNLHFPQGGIFVYTEALENTTTVYSETRIENKNLNSANCTVQCWITERDGKVVAKGEERFLELESFREALIRHEIPLDNARLWSLEDPYLYRLVSVIKSGDAILDRVSTKFGVRTFTVDADKGLFLNGKHVKVYGVNCHQDHAGVGSALPDYLQYYRIRLLKEFGVNAYRTSHNPPAPELLDACDSLGMLVMDETRLLNSSPEYMDQFSRLILRDRNHPSIFMWAIGNEEGWVQRTGVGKRIALSMLAELEQLDPTRTATYAADLANFHTGINEVIPVRGFNYRIHGIDDYHQDHPGQPTIGTEMGSTVTTRGIYEKDTVRCYVPDQDIMAPWWASLAEYWWSIAATRDWFMGGFIWTGFDYRGEPTPFGWPNINSHFGIMDMCGFPKNIYYYYQSWWTDLDVLHISPHWNWPGREGDTIDVWVNSNAGEVELILNGNSLGKKKMQPNSHLKWKVVYEPGVLEAVASKEGRIFRSRVETTGNPYRVVLSPDRVQLIADGKDATVINVSVLDKDGREVPDANNLIQFSIAGEGRIIGVGNGDPSSHEPDRVLDGKYQRHLFSGKCQVILQSDKKEGRIELAASSEGLTGDVAAIRVTAVLTE